MPTPVWSTNDWDPLEEIIIGSARGFTQPPLDASLMHFFEPPDEAASEKINEATRARAVDETEEDLAALTSILMAAGVTVRRPSPPEPGRIFATPAWESMAMHALMPRDCLLVIGDRIIEAPMPLRSRFFEVLPFRQILRGYFEQGAVWMAAPKPELEDSTYVYKPGRSVIADAEPLFDAANMLRCGRDVFFNVSNTGNRKGAEWLRRVLGSDFNVHEMSICADHVGTTLHIIRPGLLLANSARLSRDLIPAPLQSWQTIWVEQPDDDGYAFEWPRASIWIGMNILALDQETVIVPDNQIGIMRQLAAAGIEPVPAKFRHGRTFGGGFHCCSLDVRRRGTLENYL